MEAANLQLLMCTAAREVDFGQYTSPDNTTFHLLGATLAHVDRVIELRIRCLANDIEYSRDGTNWNTSKAGEITYIPIEQAHLKIFIKTSAAGHIVEWAAFGFKAGT